MDSITRNYHAHGGNEWVFGGKLTFLPGATVEGAEGLFDLPKRRGAGAAGGACGQRSEHRSRAAGGFQPSARRAASVRPDGFRMR